MKRHSTLTRLLILFLVLLTVSSIPMTALATDAVLPVPIEDGDDPMNGISLFAYNYNRIPEEMMDNSILRALAYTGYDVAYLKSIQKLYNKSYIASSLKKNAPDVLSGIPYSSDGTGSGLQTVTDKSTPTGKAPNIKYFKNQTGLDCADFVTYYLCNYLPNIEGEDTSMFDEMQKKYGYRQDDMRFWMKGCEDLAKQGRCEAYLLDSKDYENNTADYQNAIANCMPGDLIRFGTSSEDWVHYAIYAGSYDGEDYIIHVANSRGPEISLIRYMTDSSSKTSVPLAFYHFDWNDIIKDGKIEIYKKNPSGAGLQGAEFTAVNQETGDQYRIGPTNSSGYASYEPIPYGSYTVTETKFPSGYQASGTTSWTVTVGDDTPTVTINAVNQLITGTIGIKKTDDTGKALSGVQFCVYSNSSCTTLVSTITTNSSGVATLAGLTPGTTYYLKEKAAPDGHVYNGTVYPVTVVGNTTTYANSGNPVVNTRMGRIQLQKKDKNGSLGAGYVFGIYSDAACTALVQTITTDDTGTAISSLMAPGTYYVRETALPDTDTSHALNVEVSTITVQAGNTVTVEVINDHLKGGLKVRKADDAGTPLADVVFGVYLDAECTQPAADPIRTDAEGVASVQLDVGTYYVRELEAPEGYVMDDGIYTVTVRAGLDTYVNQGNPVVNTRMGRIQIFKKDKMGSLGAGYMFGIYSDEACTALVQTITTDDTGSAVSGLLAPGTYYVKETTLPDTDTVHTLNTQTVTVTVRPGATAKTDVINAFKKGNIGVLKTDDIGTPLAGAVFGIYFDLECTSSASVPIRTNAEGIGTKQIDVGTYYIREVKAPDGHIMDDNVYCITVVADETVYINSGEPVVNIRMGRLQVLKQDKYGTLGAGFEFTLYADYKCTEPVSVFATGSTGIAISDWLPEGRYYLKETKLPEDTIHVLGTASYSIDIYPGQITEVTITNSLQQGNIGVRKTDDAGTSMSGIIFGVYSDPEATKLAAVPIRTNENGVATTSLEPGTYYVREITQKPEYVLDQRIYPVTVIAGTTTYINNGDPVINTRKGKIELIKKDPEVILGAGYVFGIYADEACAELVQTITTDETGTAVSDWLIPDNTYYIKEISLPEDDTIHAVSEEIFPIEVLPGETGQVTVINEFLPGQITILKTSQLGQKLSGAKFLLEWSEDGQSWQRAVYTDNNAVTKGTCTSENLEDGCLTTDTDGTAIFSGLHPMLHYRITEIAAPEGYQLLTEPVYTGALPSNTLELGFTVVNAKPFELPQTGSQSSMLMPVSLLLCAATCMGIFVYLRKKKKEA